MFVKLLLISLFYILVQFLGTSWSGGQLGFHILTCYLYISTTSGAYFVCLKISVVPCYGPDARSRVVPTGQ
jgi:hypothetical protein